MKKLLSLTVLNNLDPIPLALGPVKRPAPQPKPALTSVPGKPHLFMDAAGRMQYLPPEPPKEAPATPAPQVAQRTPLLPADAIVPKYAVVSNTVARQLHEQGRKVQARAHGTVIWFDIPEHCNWRPEHQYRVEKLRPAGEAEDVWLDTPPPAPGWYCASSEKDKSRFRWWNGTNWSIPGRVEDTPGQRLAKKTVKSLATSIRWNPSVTVPWSD